MAVRDQTLSFRLTRSEKARIQAEADRAGAESAGDHARSLVFAALDGGEVAELRRDIEVLRREVARLHRDLGNSVIRLLQHAGSQTKEEAADWAKARLSVPPREKSAGPAEEE